MYSDQSNIAVRQFCKHLAEILSLILCITWCRQQITDSDSSWGQSADIINIQYKHRL